ncbi:ankycorbin-like [Lineus longissimus]|uniref:ankycorbin-like n=1 Tax=Lineus longissimus TaxID=88925 RepID=UPI00315D0C41
MTDSDEDNPRKGNDALIRAVKAGKVRVVTSLLESKIDVDAQDDSGQTALMMAVEVGKEDLRTHMVRCLLKKKANVSLQDDHGMTVLMHACAKLGRDDVVRQIVRNHRCDPNTKDDEGNNALIHAVYSGNAPAIRIIVNSSFTKSKLNVDLWNGSGMTALFLAFKLQQSECCRVLVNEGRADTGSILDKQGLYRILNGESFISPQLHRRSISENRAAPMKHPKPQPIVHPMRFPDINIRPSCQDDSHPAIPTQKKKKKRKHKKKRQRRGDNLDADDEQEDVLQGPPKTLTPIATRKQVLPPTITSNRREPAMRKAPSVAMKHYNTPRRSNDTPDYASDFETDSVTGSNQLRSHPVLGPIGATRRADEDSSRPNALLPSIPLGRSSLVASSIQEDDRATTV